MQRQSSENQPITKSDVLNPLSRAWVKHIALFHTIDYQHVSKPFCVNLDHTLPSSLLSIVRILFREVISVNRVS